MTPHEPISSCTSYLDIARRMSHERLPNYCKTIFKSCNEKMYYKVIHVLLSAYRSDLCDVCAVYVWFAGLVCLHQPACCSPYVP